MDIPLSILLLLSLVFTVIGAVLVLLLQYYLYLRFSVLPEESAEQKDINTKYSLPTVSTQNQKVNMNIIALAHQILLKFSDNSANCTCHKPIAAYIVGSGTRAYCRCNRGSAINVN